MKWVDLIDDVDELLPRKWKRHVGLVFVGAFLLFPNPAMRAISWYANEKAHQIVTTLIDLDTPLSAQPGAPASGPTSTEWALVWPAPMRSAR